MTQSVEKFNQGKNPNKEKTMRVLQPYDRDRLQFETTGESLTHQSMSKECDINAIMKKWEKTGVLEHRNTFNGQYGDFTQTPDDYHEAMNQVLAANEMFETLPAQIRKKFANDPGLFLDFATDEKNAAEMVKLGLATRRVEEVIEPLQEAKKPVKTAPKTSKEEPADD